MLQNGVSQRSLSGLDWIIHPPGSNLEGVLFGLWTLLKILFWVGSYLRSSRIWKSREFACWIPRHRMKTNDIPLRPLSCQDPSTVLFRCFVATNYRTFSDVLDFFQKTTLDSFVVSLFCRAKCWSFTRHGMLVIYPKKEMTLHSFSPACVFLQMNCIRSVQHAFFYKWTRRNLRFY